MPRCFPKLRSNLYQFLNEIRQVLLPTSTFATFQIIVFPEEKRCFFIKSLFEVLSMLHSILMSTWFHFASQNRIKIYQHVIPKRLPILHPFCFVFGPQKHPSRDPTWNHLGPLFCIKTAQQASQTPPKRPPRPNLEPAWFSKSPQDGPGGFPGPHLAPFGLDFGVSGFDFEGFWLPFSSPFEFVYFIFSTTLALC